MSLSHTMFIQMDFPMSLWNLIETCEFLHSTAVRNFTYMSGFKLMWFTVFNVSRSPCCNLKGHEPTKCFFFILCVQRCHRGEICCVSLLMLTQMMWSCSPIIPAVHTVTEANTKQAQTHTKASLFLDHCVIHSRAQKPFCKTITKRES